MPGMGELLIILLIVLLIFGAGKLPAIGDALGRSIKNFKRSTAQDNDVEISSKDAQGKEELPASGSESVEEAELLQGRSGEKTSRGRERVR